MNDSSLPQPSNFEPAMRCAIEAAEMYVGATAPNPPVGAVILNAQGDIIATGAHAGQGKPHAETAAIAACEQAGNLSEAHTIVVTLEPCNHHGRTGPCTEAILRTPIQQVVIGARDPNPKVVGGGIATLKEAGLTVMEDVLITECQYLIRSFTKWITTGLPWITVKRAFREDGSMIPPPGQKTFTSEAALTEAHRLRKRADAILTGSGTILADDPLFTVRRVEDHPGKKRWLIILDRRRRVSAEWMKKAEERGFEVRNNLILKEIFKYLGEEGCLEVLVEAGPTLSDTIIKSSFYDCITDFYKTSSSSTVLTSNQAL